jgi:4-carboxymuconolactone decarboxylase
MEMSVLDAGREALVALSAALAGGEEEGIDAALEAAARDADPVSVEEVLLQSHLFLGYPAALNGFARWRELSGREGGTATDDREAWSERGEEVCRIVYGGQYEGLRANVRRLHPDMERWMVEDGYGRVLGRPGLDLATRELCIAALLAVQDVPRQLHSHLRGALNAGAAESEVMRALELAGARSDADARDRAVRTWNEVRQRTRSGA